MIDQLTFPRLAALRRAWQRVPPLPVSLARIGAALGLKPATDGPATPAPPTPRDELLAALRGHGMAVFGQRPDDPMLDLCGY